MDTTDRVSEDPTSARVTFAVLGPLEVQVGGERRPVPTGAQRALLAALLLTPGRVVGVERLVDAVWGEDPPADARGSLQTNVARLRRSLGPAGRLVRTESPGYLLDVAPGARDVDSFTDLAAAARTALAAGDPAAGVSAAERALDCWRGPAWPDLAHDPAARGEILALEELRTGAEEDRADGLLRLGRDAEAVAALEDLAARHPLRDRTVGLLVDGLHAAGRTADALAVLAGHREHLAEELGLDPSPAMADRQARLLRGEPAARAPVPAAPDRSNLPPLPVGPPGPFLGRGEDLARLEALLEAGGPVTLVGPGGVGKTRLALAAATAAGTPAAWADLAPLREPGAVVAVVADALGVEATVGAPVHEALRRRAAGLDALLVLDNCEHLLDAAAALVADLSAHAPRVRVLATSRERLGVPGERVLTVRPLEVVATGVEPAPAVALFLERARAADGDFAAEGPELDRVVEVCQALDGLPLAIELAAARVGALSVHDLAQRLDTRFELLRHGPRSAAPRHRTLRSVVDWSYELLDEDEAAVFARLSVFAARFDLSAAEHVVSGSGVAGHDVPADRVADVVARLVDRSMLTRPATRRPGPARFRMLDTLRRYALSRLSAEELARLRRRHAAWVLDLTEQAEVGLWGPAEAAWHDRCEEALPDVRLARRFASASGDTDLAVRLVASLWRWAYWRVRVEVLGWADELVETPGLTHRRLPDLWVAGGAAAWFTGDRHRATERAERAVDAAGGVVATGSGPGLELLGDIAVVGGNPLRAARHYLGAAAAYRAGGRPDLATVGTANAAMALAYAGRPDEDLLATALREAAASGNPTIRAFAGYALAESIADSDPDRALAAYEQSLRDAASVGNTLAHGVARTGVVALRGRHGPVEDAVPAFRDVVTRWQEAGARSMAVTTLRNLVFLLSRAGLHRHVLELAAALEAASEANPSYGTEAERLVAATAAAGAALGAADAAAARRAGELRTLEDAAASALAALEAR